MDLSEEILIFFVRLDVWETFKHVFLQRAQDYLRKQMSKGIKFGGLQRKIKGPKGKALRMFWGLIVYSGPNL